MEEGKDLVVSTAVKLGLYTAASPGQDRKALVKASRYKDSCRPLTFVLDLVTKSMFLCHSNMICLCTISTLSRHFMISTLLESNYGADLNKLASGWDLSELYITFLIIVQVLPAPYYSIYKSYRRIEWHMFTISRLCRNMDATSSAAGTSNTVTSVAPAPTRTPT